MVRKEGTYKRMLNSRSLSPRIVVPLVIFCGFGKRRSNEKSDEGDSVVAVAVN